MTGRIVPVFACFLAIVGMCERELSALNAHEAEYEARPHSDARPALQRVKSWGYQLQALDVDDIARSSHDLVVIDYSLDGTDQKKFTKTQLSALKQKPDGGKRIILAYLSIGEAENYRYYWRSSWKKAPPNWLAKENPEWRGNFLVKYWKPAWQKLIFGNEKSYLSRIIAAGFDGVFLDRVDAYDHWTRSRATARNDMINFVDRLSHDAKKRQQGFLVFVQNAEELLSDADYRNQLDGVVKEDLFFGAQSHTNRNSKSLVRAHIKHLRLARDHGLPVLVVEYLTSFPERASQAVQEIRDLGFIPYISNRPLDTLRSPPPIPLKNSAGPMQTAP
ncbi:MAG: MJ1477/TM1410 family putative glycoside hydrolase [Methyloligellaceae bacterium]